MSEADTYLGVGHLQHALLAVMWKAKRDLTVHEMLTVINEGAEKQLAYTTVLTVCRNLAKRGLASQLPVKGQRQHLFRPTVTREDFCRQGTREFVELFFGGDATKLKGVLDAAYPSKA
jgi:predicted transcriptional regulator